MDLPSLFLLILAIAVAAVAATLVGIAISNVPTIIVGASLLVLAVLFGPYIVSGLQKTGG